MDVTVMPAKRPGKCKQIFSRVVDCADFTTIDDRLSVSIIAEGVNSDGSSYRYAMTFSRHELALMQSALAV